MTAFQIDHVEGLFALSAAEAAARIRDPEHLSGTDGLLLAARVAADVDTAPPDSLRSQVQLVLALAPLFWRPQSVTAWRIFANNPSDDTPSMPRCFRVLA